MPSHRTDTDVTPADATRSLLRWLAAHDLPDEVVLTCADAPVPAVAPDTLTVQVPDGVASAGIGLPAQLLAMGVAHIAIETCSCHEPSDEQAPSDEQILPDQQIPRDETVQRWPAALKDVEVRHPASNPAADRPGPDHPRRRPRHLRRPSLRTPGRAPSAGTLRLGNVPVPRRMVLGVALAGRARLDLSRAEPERVHDALRQLSEQGRADLTRLHDIAPTPSPAPVLRAEGCVACGVCVMSCPHGALGLADGDDDGTTLLIHLAEKCRGEMSCLRLCPAGVLTAPAAHPAPQTPRDEASPPQTGSRMDGGSQRPVSRQERTPSRASATDDVPHIPMEQLAERPHRAIARVATARCARCGTRHPASQGTLCPTCHFRSTHAFGSAMPPALARAAGADNGAHRPRQ